jgi:hypothetical protein
MPLARLLVVDNDEPVDLVATPRGAGDTLGRS